MTSLLEYSGAQPTDYEFGFALGFKVTSSAVQSYFQVNKVDNVLAFMQGQQVKTGKCFTYHNPII